MNQLILVIVALPILAAVLVALMRELSAKPIAILGSAVACLVSIFGLTTGGIVEKGFHHVLNLRFISSTSPHHRLFHLPCGIFKHFEIGKFCCNNGCTAGLP